jgi:hypothetical protein
VWIIGLFVSPSSPDAFAPAAEVKAYFVENNRAALAQAFLVHAVAGVALAMFAVGVSRHVRVASLTEHPSRATVSLGVAAAIASFVQFGLAIAIYNQADRGHSAGGVRSLFNAVNKTDTVKLFLLAAFIVSASLAGGRSRTLPRSVLYLGAIGATALTVGGFAYLVDAAALDAVLATSLVLLLLWAVMTAVSILRGYPESRVDARESRAGPD